MKLISVIIPAYNASAFIENCINSVLKQTYTNFEIVVVNDGSKDNTLEILEALAKKDSRIVLLRNPVYNLCVCSVKRNAD